MTTNDRKITHIHIHLASRQIDRKISNLDTEELSSVWKIPHEILPSSKSTNIRRNYKITKSSRKKTTNTSLFKGAFVYLFIFFYFGEVEWLAKGKKSQQGNLTVASVYTISFPSWKITGPKHIYYQEEVYTLRFLSEQYTWFTQGNAELPACIHVVTSLSVLRKWSAATNIESKIKLTTRLHVKAVFSLCRSFRSCINDEAGHKRKHQYSRHSLYTLLKTYNIWRCVPYN